MRGFAAKAGGRVKLLDKPELQPIEVETAIFDDDDLARRGYALLARIPPSALRKLISQESSPLLSPSVEQAGVETKCRI